MFIVSLIFDLAFCKDFEEFIDDDKGKCKISTRIICGIVILLFFKYEIKQLLKTKDIYEYSFDVWNVCDVLLIFIYFAYIPISFLPVD